MTAFRSPITVAFDGRTRTRFETVVDDDPAARTAARATTRLKVQTTAEAEALLSALAGMDLLSFDPQMIPTLHRVRDELVDGLETRGYAVADADVHEQELVADGGVVEEPAHVSLERYECFECGFEHPDRDAFDADGLAMKCPDCGSLRVEHVFTVDDEDTEIMTDGGVPQSFEDLAGTCESCGEDVDPDRLIEGECPGCQYRPDVATDGGLHTVEHDGTDYVVCHMVAYDDDADLDIDNSGEEPIVTNHDEVPKHDEVRLLKLDSIREHGMEHMAISPSSSLWRDSFKFLEPGDSVRLDDEEPMADGGGVTWTDLHAFQRDCLEAIRRLDNEGETTYGLAIKRELERCYGEEVNHGRLYPNLDDLVDAGLVEKSELDNRTNSYDLTSEGEAMLEQRARLLADACGMQQPVADGGDSA